MCRNSFRIPWMADDMHIAAGNRRDHRLCVCFFILRRENRFMEARNNQIQRGQHRAGAVDFTVGVLNVRFDAAKDPDTVNQPWPDAHIHKMPVVRSISHIRTVIGNRKKLDAF